MTTFTTFGVLLKQSRFELIKRLIIFYIIGGKEVTLDGAVPEPVAISTKILPEDALYHISTVDPEISSMLFNLYGCVKGDIASIKNKIPKNFIHGRFHQK